ncbi:hypothetical protein Gotur_007250, partial [Gossypium turneri]
RVEVTLNIACKICETCRVVGVVLIIAGLYPVILGKREESKYQSENDQFIQCLKIMTWNPPSFGHCWEINCRA